MADEDLPPPEDDPELPPEDPDEPTPGYEERFAFDAPLADKQAWETRVLLPPPPGEADDEQGSRDPTVNVRLPGEAITNATGPRAPVAGQHNWIPTGPRNIGGRVSALAVDPSDPRIMYAGAAAGGVHKSVDGGETWFPLWHEEPSLAMAAISICRDHPEVVWAATGEIQTGGGEEIRGNGIYRSADHGVNWANPMPAPAPGQPPVPGTVPAAGAADQRGFHFDGLAAHPTDSNHCWAVGPSGIFRTLDGGATWTQFENGVYYSDVVFSEAGTPAQPILYLVRAISFGGEAVIVRIDNPGAADAAITAAIGNANNQSQVVAAPTPALAFADRPTRGKLAIAASNRDIAYVRFVTQGSAHFRVFRTRNARATPPRTVSWTRLRNHPDWADEGQGSYNLSIAVSPRSPNHVVTGMVELYFTRNANSNNPGNVNWVRAMAWDLYHLDRAHHADNHVALFADQPGAAPADPPALWVANDGGISRSLDWSTRRGSYASGNTSLPVPDDVITWRKRSHGITAAQMYDVSQSALVPTMFGCGFQDNGVFVTSGGQTWRFVLGADGGFVAFDPDDPYKLIATWQGGIAEVVFPGNLAGMLPLAGDALLDGLWPRQQLQRFLPSDGALFVADTVHHPLQGDRVLHARVNRLYGSREALGDRWEPEPVGRALELIYDSGAATATIEVLPSPGARRLGLLPQVAFDRPDPVDPTRSLARPATAVARVQSVLPGPYALQAADELRLVLDGAPTTIRFDPPLPATPGDVAERIRARAPNMNARARFWATPLCVEITATGAAADQQITLGGTALAVPAGSLFAPLGLVPRAYSGTPDRPATVTLIAFARDMTPPGPAALTLTVQIGARPVRTVTFNAASFLRVDNIRVGELQQALQTALAGDPVTVTAVNAVKGVRLTGTGGAGVRVTGTAAARLNLPSGGAAQPTLLAVPRVPVGRLPMLTRSFDLDPGTGANRRLVIGDGTNTAAPLVFAPPNPGDFGSVTPEELRDLINAHIAAHNAAVAAGAAVRVRADVQIALPEGGFFAQGPSELAYSSSEPDTVWIGGGDSSVFRSTDDGAHWTFVGDPRFESQDRPIEAIAIDPESSDTVYVGLEGRSTIAGDPGFLFKTTDAGATWGPIGATVVDSAGNLVGVYALEIDPVDTRIVFAATDVGVFRTTNAGASWAPFNEGLPNTIVRDLAFVPATRTLRAGAWGRGTFERHVGKRAAKDVQVYVRQSELDEGSQRPARRGPDGYSGTPRALSQGESPDIKVNRLRPPQIGADELVDGVEFDEDVRHEEPVEGPSLVFVQVHNRGSFAATNVRVVALWADATNGPPRLPDDFWTRFAAGALPADVGAWKTIGEHTIAGAATPQGRIDPGYPRVHTFDYAWPDLGAIRRVGILVLTSCAGDGPLPADALSATELDVSALLARDPKIAYRETGTVRVPDDARLFVRSTTARQLAVANPAAGTSAAAALGLAVGGPVSEVLGGVGPFNLSAGAPQQVDFTIAETITVQFAAGRNDVANLARASVREVRTILNREFTQAGIPLRCDFELRHPPAAPDFRLGIRLRGAGGALFRVTGGTAAASLGLAVGAAFVGTLRGGVGLYDLSAGPPQTLSIDVTARAGARFRAGENGITNLAAVTTRQAREVLNRAFAAGSFPAVAIVPRVDLWVRRSITDVGGAPVAPSRRGLADVVVAPAAVPPGAGREALFDLVTVYREDTVRASTDNAVYVRSANLGTASVVDPAQPRFRHRLFQLAVTAAPLTTTAIGGDVLEPIPAGGFAIVEFTWNPGAAAAGDRLFVLAVADHDSDGRRLDVPATFATIEELDAFCDAHPNAAYREVSVGA